MKHEIRMTRRPRVQAGVLLSLVLFAGVLLFPHRLLTAPAGGGNQLWDFLDVRSGKQESTAMAVDPAGAVYLAGYNAQTGTDDYDLVKIKADGTGLGWRASVGAAGGDDRAVDVAVDDHGDAVVTGYAWNGSNYDIQTLKYRGTDGVQQWTQVFNGTANGHDYARALGVDGNGNVYVGGHSQTSGGTDDFVLVKYASDGRQLWAVTRNGSASLDDRARALVVGQDGVVVAGESKKDAATFELLVVKYALDGTFQWQGTHAFAGDPSRVRLRLDGSGNVVVVGPVMSGTEKAMMIARRSSSGALSWQVTHRSQYDEEPGDVWVDETGDVYVTGYTFHADTAHDYFTIKLSGTSGEVAWSSTLGTVAENNDLADRITGVAGGDLFVTGHVYDLANGHTDVRTVKVARQTGALLWEQIFNGHGNDQSQPVGVAVSSDGNVLVGGWTHATTTDSDVFVVKYEAGVLNRPTHLSAEVVSGTQVQLTWWDNSNNEDGFTLERKQGNTWTTAGTVAANGVTKLDTGLTPDTEYTYRVRSFRGSNQESPTSEEIQVFTTSVTVAHPDAVKVFRGQDNGDDTIHAVATGPDNHVAAVGSTYSHLGQVDYLTLKLDRTDLHELATLIHDGDQNAVDTGESVAVDAVNRMVVTGSSEMYTSGIGNTVDFFTLRYDTSDYAMGWSAQYNSVLNGNDQPVALAMSADGLTGFSVVGFGRNSANNDDVLAVRYNADGTRRWAATPYDRGGTQGDYPAAAVMDAVGDLVMAGRTHNGTSWDWLVVKYNGLTGATKWGVTYGSAAGADEATAVAVDRFGAVYVAGVVENGAGSNDAWVVKYNGTTGAREWERLQATYGSGVESAVGVAVDLTSNDVLLGGTLQDSGGNGDLFATRLDRDGNVRWERTLLRPTSDERARAMAVDLAGNVHVAGETWAGNNWDLVHAQWDATGSLLQTVTYDGPANRDDRVSALSVNRYGEAFLGGATTGAANDHDALVLKVDSHTLEVPAPFTGDPSYTRLTLSWSDNCLFEDGYELERKDGLCEAAAVWVPLTTRAANVQTYEDTGLLTGTGYCYRIAAFTNSGKRTPWLEMGTATQTPAIPNPLTGTAPETNKVNLAFVDRTTGEEGFKVERCSGAGCSTFTLVGTANANTAAYADTAVCPGTSYTYRVRAFQGTEWASGYTNTLSLTTPASTAPTGLTATRISEGEVALAWTDRTTGESGFAIQRCVNAGCSDFTDLASTLPGVVTYRDTNVLPNTTYQYRVMAYSAATCTWSSGMSNVASATTTLNGPTGLNSTIAEATRIDLWWTDTTGTESRFVVERCDGPGCSSFTAVGTPAANTPNFQDTSVCATSTYRYRVKASRTTAPLWETAYSNTTGDLTTPTPTPPTLPVATALSESQIQFSWTDSTAGETGYRIERCQGAGCSNFAEITTTSYWQVSITDGGLSPGTSYSYRVRAYRTATCSWQTVYSAVVSATTQSPPPPTNVSASAVNTTQVDVTWTDNTGSESNFGLERCTGAACDFTSGVTAFTAGVNAVRYGDTSACNGTTYRYRVRANRTTAPIWQTAWGGPATVATPAAPPPTNITATPMNESQVALAWTDTASDESGYRIERCTGAGCSNFAEIGTVAANVVAYTDSNLSLNTVYNYRVRGYKTATCSWTTSYAGPVTATTGIPTAPGILVGTVVNTTQVDLGWADTTGSETRFVVERCTGAGCNFTGAVDTFPVQSNVVTYSDRAACQATAYVYRVKAERTGAPAWTTPWSNTAAALAASARAPTGVTAHADSDLAVHLAWVDNSTDETGAEILRCQGAGCTNMAVVGMAAADATTYLDTPVSPETSYTYTVRSYKNSTCGWNAPSTNVTVLTAPAAPGNTIAVAINSFTVRVGWADVSASEDGFEIERQIWNGKWVVVGRVGPDMTTFVDRAGLEPEKKYRYRVRAYRGSDRSEYRGEASVTMPAWQTGDGACK